MTERGSDETEDGGRTGRRRGSAHLLFHDVLVHRRDAQRLLLYIFAVAFAGALTISLAGLLASNSRNALIGGIAAGACLLLSFIVQLGFAGLAASLGTIVLLALAMGSVVTGNGIHDVSMILFPFVIVVSNLLFNRTLATTAGWTAVLLATGAGLLEAMGVLQSPLASLTALEDVLAVFILLAGLTLAIQHLVKMMERGFSQASAQELSYRNIFNATSEGILIHDADTGTFLDVNETAQRMFGYSRMELIGGTFEMLFAPDAEAAREGRRMLDRCRHRGPQIFSWRSRTKSGNEVPLEITLKSATLADREVILAVVRDMTERLEMQNRLLEGEKLQAVGQLAGGVAHDFNNQLTGILANATLLRDMLEESDSRLQCVDAIISCSKRSADLTQQLLAFARRGKHQNVVVDVHELIQEVESLLRRSIDKRIRIEMHLCDETLLLVGDPTLLQSAFLNLGLNARDAMPEGGTLTFRTRVEHQSAPDTPHRGELLVVEVTDTGHGMDEATRDRVFEPFFTTKKGGNGMGLAAVYGAAESHGGDVSVSSRPMEGAIFCLRFPRAVDAESPQEPSLSRITAAHRLDGLRVLLAEDEVQVAAIAEQILKRMGCSVVSCFDGEEAVRKFREAPDEFDVAILDHMMPKMSGREAIREFQKVRPDLPCLITSGYANDAVVEGAPGKVLFLPKPFAAARLANALAQVTRDDD